MILMRKSKVLIILVVLWTAGLFYSHAYPCDILVVASWASTTGRPFIWKTRDCAVNWHQEIKYYDAVTVSAGAFVMVSAYDDWANYNNGIPVNPSGGLNEAGFAVACTSVYEDTNLTDELNNINTMLLWDSLEQCATIEDFDAFLNNWRQNNSGKVISGNFVAIDANGGAALYECYSGGTSGPLQFRKYDANTGTITLQDGSSAGVDTNAQTYGFVNRANANTYLPNEFGEERRWRARCVLTNLAQTGRLNYRNCMTEVSKDVVGQQVDNLGNILDDGTCHNGTDYSCLVHYSTTYCISRASSRLGMVVDGVAAGNDPRLSVFWCVLGEPSVGVFVPYFVNARGISYLSWADDVDLDGNLYDLNDVSFMSRACNRRETFQHLIYPDNTGSMLTGMNEKHMNKIELSKVQQWTFPLEAFVFQKTEEYLADMTAHPSYITTENLKNFSDYCAEYVYCNFDEGSADARPWTFAKPWNPTWGGYTRSGLDSSTDSMPVTPLPPTIMPSNAFTSALSAQITDISGIIQ
jgi:hypothetical protein